MSLFGGSKTKILIAEDDPSLRKVLMKKLESAGYKVLEASDGEIAINLALQEKPDLVILDELMPKYTGTGVVKRLRGDPEWGAKVPVFILTNIDEGTNTYEQVKDLANRYFIKSNTPLDTIIAAIKETLG
jgi:DNA-binding response OmpR family regulator